MFQIITLYKYIFDLNILQNIDNKDYQIIW